MGRNAQDPLDVRLAALARRQHGVVSLAQLRALGLSASGVRSRVERGRLHPRHRGVYAVGHACVGADAIWMAAVLACGRGAVLSHRDAAALHGLRPSARARIDVTVPRQAGRRRPGIDAHSSALHPDDVIAVARIPCTSVARTLLDLGDVLPARGVERAVGEAERLRVFDMAAVRDVLERAGGRRGAAKLRCALLTEPAMTREELEDRFYAICRHARVARPSSNYPIDRYEADFCWPDLWLIVETDGWAAHGTRHAFEHDRARARHLVRLGWTVVHFTWREIADHPAAVAAELRALISARRR